MLHRGAVQPNNASEHEFWPAVNRNEVELEEAALVESRKLAYYFLNKVVVRFLEILVGGEPNIGGVVDLGPILSLSLLIWEAGAISARARGPAPLVSVVLVRRAAAVCPPYRVRSKVCPGMGV